MKNVITYILREEGQEENFRLLLAIGRREDPEAVIRRLLVFKNRMLKKGEKPISLVSIRAKPGVSFEHDWIKSSGVYKCGDCGVFGKRATPLSKIKPISGSEQHKNCKWKIKIPKP